MIPRTSCFTDMVFRLVLPFLDRVVESDYDARVRPLTHTPPDWCTPGPKTLHRNSKAKPVRQSVTIPAPLAAEVRRVAKERHFTMSRALISLAERGVRAESEAKENLNATYKRFMEEQEPGRKEEAGKDLIRAVFGNICSNRAYQKPEGVRS